MSYVLIGLLMLHINQKNSFHHNICHSEPSSIKNKKKKNVNTLAICHTIHELWPFHFSFISLNLIDSSFFFFQLWIHKQQYQKWEKSTDKRIDNKNERNGQAQFMKRNGKKGKMKIDKRLILFFFHSEIFDKCANNKCSISVFMLMAQNAFHLSMYNCWILFFIFFFNWFYWNVALLSVHSTIFLYGSFCFCTSNKKKYLHRFDGDRRYLLGFCHSFVYSC